MKVAVYSLTRDRLDYTKHCFQTLKEKAGMEYDHFIIDNGSEDGTQEWLKTQNFKQVIFNKENVGISKASNQALEEILKGDYDLIIKFDNDCEVVSENIIGQITEIYQDIKKFDSKYVLSPRVEGINHQPARGHYTQLAERRIGITGVVGGLFHIVPRSVYRDYRYAENLPKAKGQDETFCEWARHNGCEVGYIEGLVVNHYEGTDNQAKRYPDYFKRKWNEEAQN